MNQNARIIKHKLVRWDYQIKYVILQNVSRFLLDNNNNNNNNKNIRNLTFLFLFRPSMSTQRLQSVSKRCYQQNEQLFNMLPKDVQNTYCNTQICFSNFHTKNKQHFLDDWPEKMSTFDKCLHNCIMLNCGKT